jgi:protein-disulfide isomerase
MCPNCKRFEESVAAMLDRAVTAGRVTVVTHPVAFLDRMSQGTEYSTRAVAAAGCAADGGRFTEYVRVLFQQQPAEHTRGLTDDRLVALGRDAGLADGFAQCVRDGTYRGWAAHVSEQAARAGVVGTPTVKVNGKVTDADPAAISAALGHPG